MSKEFKWTDAEVKKILHAATGNIKDFVMNEDGFLSDFKASHSTDKIEWEIVSFKVKGIFGIEDQIWSLNKNGKYSCETNLEYSIQTMIKDGDKIHSVRRLSDNEVFKVGDDIQQGEITGIFIGKYGLDIDVCKNDKYYDRYTLWQLKKIEKRKPLFTTEDGVDKYSGEECVLVKVKTLEISGWYNLPKNLDKLAWDFNSYKHFHSRDAAQEYVLMNKPLLSVNDVINVPSWYSNNNDRSFRLDKLKELAKTKL